jgi:hypothetical protein
VGATGDGGHVDPNAILNRLMRLARLDTGVFDEVRDDPRETLPAIIIVAVSALLAGFGALLFFMFVKPAGADADVGNLFVKVIVLGTIFAVVLWGVWVAVTYVVLVQFFKETADIQVLLRTMGYASIPFAASLLMLIPGLSMGLAITALVLWFVLSIYAVQAATSASPDRVIISCLVGFLVFAVLMGIIARSSGLTTGAFVFSEGYKTAIDNDYYEASSSFD